MSHQLTNGLQDKKGNQVDHHILTQGAEICHEVEILDERNDSFNHYPYDQADISYLIIVVQIIGHSSLPEEPHPD